MKINATQDNQSFFSGDGGAVIVGKIAAKLDCGSVLSQKSNNFKQLGPVNLTTINLEVGNGSRNITFQTTNSYLVAGERKLLEQKSK